LVLVSWNAGSCSGLCPSWPSGDGRSLHVSADFGPAVRFALDAARTGSAPEPPLDRDCCNRSRHGWLRRAILESNSVLAKFEISLRTCAGGDQRQLSG